MKNDLPGMQKSSAERVHDVANLKAVKRNNGGLFRLDRVHIEGTGHAIFKNTTSLPHGTAFFSFR